MPSPARSTRRSSRWPSRDSSSSTRLHRASSAVPPRVEYEVTDRGTEEFFTLLREALSSHEQKSDVLSAGIGFIVYLPRGEAFALLEQRIAGLEQWRSAVTEYYKPEDGPEQLGHIGEIMNMWVHSADGGAEWTRGLIERIEGGAYTFAGEGKPFVGVLADDEPNPRSREKVEFL
jgi:hypothetical protein